MFPQYHRKLADLLRQALRLNRAHLNSVIFYLRNWTDSRKKLKHAAFSGSSAMKKAKQNRNYGPVIDLRKLELEVLAEGAEWMRRRLQEKLRETSADFSPDENPTPRTAPETDH